MKLIEMTIKNVDGKNITKKIEDRLVPYYKSLGWTIKKKPKRGEEYKSTIDLEK